jgi:hypothetical protein
LKQPSQHSKIQQEKSMGKIGGTAFAHWENRDKPGFLNRDQLAIQWIAFLSST